MIISSPENFEHRKIIREVIRLQLPRWEKTVISYPGSQNKMDATIKALFFVGQPANSSKESMVCCCLIYLKFANYFFLIYFIIALN